MRAMVAVALLVAGCTRAPEPLRVCLDPDNLPFSDRAGRGFENALAELLASDLHRPLEIVWWAQRRGFARNTVGAKLCDVWPGVATGFDRLATTRPYYRSSYVFVTRSEDHLSNLTLDDPRLRRLRIGVQLIGDDGSNTPPAEALARRGVVDKVRGFMVADERTSAGGSPAIMRAVDAGVVDVALVWGPTAGYFRTHSRRPLQIQPVSPWLDANRWPMAFDISVGVAKDRKDLAKQIDQVLRRRSNEIRRMLLDHRVIPRVSSEGV